jgi:hypothetical protein
MKSDISGRRRLNPFLIFFFARHLSQSLTCTWGISTAWNYIYFPLHLPGRKLLGSKHVFINKTDVCQVSATSCPRIYIYTLLLKHAFTLLLAGCHAISSKVPVNKVNPWKHLHLISSHKPGAFLMLDFPRVSYDNSWFTSAAPASLRKSVFFPLETLQCPD